MEERTDWIERINGRRMPVDRYRLDQPGIRPRIVHPPLLSCTASAARHAVMTPPRPIGKRSAQRAERAEAGGRALPDRDPLTPNPLLTLWVSVCAWVSSLFAAEQPAPAQQLAPEPLVHALEPAPVARMTVPVRPRVRPTRPVVWSRERAPRARVRVERPRTTRIVAIARGTGPPRRRRSRVA